MVIGKEQMLGVQLKAGRKNPHAKGCDGDRFSGTAERPGQMSHKGRTHPRGKQGEREVETRETGERCAYKKPIWDVQGKLLLWAWG